VLPPSITNSDPVTKEDSSEDRALPILACVSLKKGVADYIKATFKLGLALL
jgi:hypothetical protein